MCLCGDTAPRRRRFARPPAKLWIAEGARVRFERRQCEYVRPGWGAGAGCQNARCSRKLGVLHCYPRGQRARPLP